MKLTRAKDIIFEELDGGALLVSTSSGNRWSLNATAGAMWRLCDGRMTVTEIASALKCRVEEIAMFCDQFRSLGLLKAEFVTDTGADLPPGMVTYHSAPGFKAMGLGAGPRRRPSPRGVSGPG